MAFISHFYTGKLLLTIDLPTDLYHGWSHDLHVYGSKVRAVPAVDDDRPCGGRVGHLDAADEGQQSCGVVRHSVIGPAGEMELLHLSHLIKTPL